MNKYVLTCLVGGALGVVSCFALPPVTEPTSDMVSFNDGNPQAVCGVIRLSRYADGDVVADALEQAARNVRTSGCANIEIHEGE